jgi:hypothetical protein
MSGAISAEATEAATEYVANHVITADIGPIVRKLEPIIQSAITKACAERDAKLEKVKRVCAIAATVNENQTEMEAAVCCSLNEAMAHDLLEQTEKERDAVATTLQKIAGSHADPPTDLIDWKNQVQDLARATLAEIKWEPKG